MLSSATVTQSWRARWPAPISRRPASASTISRGRDGGVVADEANYLVNVLRLARGARVLVFNGRDGEFAATLGATTRKRATLTVGERIRAQEFPPDVDYLFAPLKHARLDYMAQKAVEMGARAAAARHHAAHPGDARQSRAPRRQCARSRRAVRRHLAAGDRAAASRSTTALARWPAERLLVFCDEDAPIANPLAALRRSA